MITGIAMMPETVDDARRLSEIILSTEGFALDCRENGLRPALAEQVVSDDILIAWDVADRCGLDRAFYLSSVAKQISIWLADSDIHPLDVMFPFPPDDEALAVIQEAISGLDARLSNTGIPISARGWVGIDDFRGSEARLTASPSNPLVRLLTRVCGRSPLAENQFSNRIMPLAARVSSSHPAYLEFNLDTMMGWCAAALVAADADLSVATTPLLETAAA